MDLFFALSFSYKYVFVILTFPQYCYELTDLTNELLHAFLLEKTLSGKRYSLKRFSQWLDILSVCT